MSYYYELVGAVQIADEGPKADFIEEAEKLFTELGYVVRPPSLVVHYESRQIHIDEVNGRVAVA